MSALGNIVGFKPTLGLVSTLGVVPACRSLDCVSVFALTARDAAIVFDAMDGPDPRDPVVTNNDLVGANHGTADSVRWAFRGILSAAYPQTPQAN